MTIPQGRAEWEALAQRAVQAYVASRGAVVWAEVEAVLGESDWIRQNVDSTLPSLRNPQPHHLHTARQRLLATGEIVEEAATLTGTRVSAFIDGGGLAGRQKTILSRRAASKRRLYRTFLSWTSASGRAAESVVEASLSELEGSHIWVPPSAKTGNVRSILGRDIEVGGPLDAAGQIALNPEDPSEGLVPFAVEVKNLRSTIYPWDQETWDLLAKLAAFPDVAPILIARRLHVTTFRFLKDVGGLGINERHQWFRRNIAADTFASIVGEFGFADARRVDDPVRASPRVTKLFRETVLVDVAGTPLIERQVARWARSPEIAANYLALRDDLDPATRSGLWHEFSEAVVDAGLYETRGWAPADLV